MRASLRRLIDESLDLSPFQSSPQTPMRDAVTAYLRAVDGPLSFVLGRFVCSAEKLRELGAELSRLTDAPTIPVTVVGRVSHDEDTWEPHRSADADDMNAFLDDAEELADIEAYEVSLPKLELLDEHLKDLSAFSEVEVCVGLPWADDLHEALATISDADFALVQGHEPVSSAHAAALIHGCDALELPFKITGRFSGPFSEGGKLGVVSVLAAAALTTSEDLSRKQVEQILVAPANAFVFDEEGLQFGELKADLNAIDESREMLAALGASSLDILRWVGKQ